MARLAHTLKGERKTHKTELVQLGAHDGGVKIAVVGLEHGGNWLRDVLGKSSLAIYKRKQLVEAAAAVVRLRHVGAGREPLERRKSLDFKARSELLLRICVNRGNSNRV